MTRRPLVAGKLEDERAACLRGRTGGDDRRLDAQLQARAELLICPPATLLASFPAVAVGSGLAIGAQDCHPDPCGAHTGDISAEMIADAGARLR